MYHSFTFTYSYFNIIVVGSISFYGIEAEITEAFENSSKLFMHTKDWFKEIEKLLKNVWLDEELYMLEKFINVPCKCEVCVEKSHDKI